MCRNSRGSTSGKKYFYISYFIYFVLWLHPIITFISFLLFQVFETDKDPMTSSQALGLAKNELGGMRYFFMLI
jgi:hypothetical protein